ncbi:probable leucine-rich repeat receptor-like protein kinase At5g49770 [Neltuma alba]|uniref:probable leucine-rich repeat receptor-like protein kinase At5g49770 n=1 Tax=Neltuma alba TaxID=207710 RepID=UPI0010A4449D|nr:probable leucine-rich repeat receptor-like protein kinase At5g49770 [Prosopis alba]
MMGERVLVLLVLVFTPFLVAETGTAHEDFVALKSLMDTLKDTPASWSSPDPCDGSWEGIKCTNSRVTSIKLSGTDLTGQLSGDIGSLSELETLDLSYNKGLTGSLPPEIANLQKLSNLFLVDCSFTGPIPDNIGSLQQLVFLSLNKNRFSGKIPPSIGNLTQLTWLDLTENELEGLIPVSSGSMPGLDKLLNTKHFHLGKNKLSGEIPPQLFTSEMTLKHVLLDSNKLTGNIPLTLGLVQSLEVVRFDNNSLIGNLPQNINNLTNLQEMYFSNNKLSGPMPSLSRMNFLAYLDMSNNSFDRSDFPPWLPTLWNLTTLKMENTKLTGEIPASFFTLAHLQNVVLNGNNLNGSLNIGTTYSKQLRRIELQGNEIVNCDPQDPPSNIKITLVSNPICYEGRETRSFCSDAPANMTYAAPPSSCPPVTCRSDQNLSPNCKCAYPFEGILSFRTPSFPDWQNSLPIQKFLMRDVKANNLPVDSVSVTNLTQNQFKDVELTLQVFPSREDHFNRTETSSITSLLSNLTTYPFYFYPYPYGHYEEPVESSKSSNVALITGAIVGCSVVLVLLLFAGVYAFYQKKRAEKAISQSNPFGKWVSNDNKVTTPNLRGVRQFSFAEVKKYTRNFSQANDIGAGGYGKVYRGTLPNGQLVAIKRAQRESKQGGLEFKAEIELLSRAHHNNLVSLVGFCFEREEQMLVYEYVPNGTLHGAISGKSALRLDWPRRLKVILGAAKGLAYLHDHANPRIIHRDIKSTNILLDDHLNAKVADFGLSKTMVDCGKDHITTQVKGTMGYLDPEYYTSQHLTEKSDVYSFGVLMLEMITARKPIEKGKYVVKVVRNLIDRTKELYGLEEIIDPVIGSESTLKGLENFVDLSLKCLQETGADRPSMNDVVKEIESILKIAGLNDTSGSMTSNSASYDEITRGTSLDLYSNDSFDSGAVPLQLKLEPKQVHRTI